MTLLEQIAESHFKEHTRESLVKAVYNEIDDDNLFEFFAIDNLLVKRAIAKKINKKIRDKEFLYKIIQGLNAEPEIRQGVLTALSYSVRFDNRALLHSIKLNLKHGNENVKKAAATVIAHRYSDHAPDLVPYLDADIAKIICYSQNDKVIFPLLEFYNYPENKNLPPSLGFLLNPRWLAKNHAKDIDYLIDEFGYCNCAVDDHVLMLLNQGFMFVSKEMALSPQIVSWQKRIQGFSINLLPFSLGMSENMQVNLEDKIDTSLFLAAVRESDVSNLQIKKQRDPFSYRSKESIEVLTCAHTPYRFFKQKFIDKAVELGKELDVKNLGGFVVDYAKVMLETDSEARAEADMLLRTKWLTNGEIRSYPVLKDEDFSKAKFAVINEFNIPEPDKKLSKGANSLKNIADYLNINIDKLAELEQAYSFLLPVGIEIQIPKTNKNTALAWKQALRYFDIPSPRRPEYKYMVEAAFHAFRSFHGPIIGTMLLHKLGVIKDEQDMAYHISIENDIKDVKYIAFPQQFINRARRELLEKEAKFKRMAPLMSKGFVNLNDDVEQCYNYTPCCRTEVRVCGCFTDNDNLRLSFVDDLISTHLLLCASFYGLNEFKEYKKEIDEYTATLPSDFRELLDSNWYEATGDPRDSYFVRKLPVIQKREQVFSMVDETNTWEEFENKFHEIIGKYTKIIHNKFLELFNVNIDFSSFALSRYDIPYYVPERIKIEDGHVLS